MWQVCARLRSLWRRQRQEAELDEEIRFHLAEEMEERIAAGMSPEDARAAAQRDFGNVPLLRELTRETWGWGPAERLLQDVRSAIRGMRRNPGYTLAVVLTLALGIGLNAAMYGMLSRLFLQPPPHVEDPDGIHRLWVRERFDWGRFAGTVVAGDTMNWAEFSALRDGPDSFRATGGYTAPRAMQNGRGQAAESLLVSRVSGDLFALLGARPALGRPILPEDDDVTAAPVAVIGNSYWERRFGGTRDALGATATFGDVTYEIVGVMPPAFSGPEPNAADVWLPLRESDSFITALVRLAPGVTVEAAGAAATSAVRAARADSPLPADIEDKEATALLGPLLRTRGPGTFWRGLQLPLVVGGVALAVLLIATANVSNLLMLRVAARRRELAVRHALGAGRWGVGRLLVTESVLLAALSGVAALGVAAVAGRLLRVTLLPRYQWAGGTVDVTAIAFTGVAVLAVGLVAALFPALYAARSRGIERLDGLRGARSLGGPVRTGLIVVQAALSLVALDGAAVFYRSFEAARQLDVGYARRNLLTVRLGGSPQTTPLNESTIDAMEARVRSLPGVLDVAQGTNSPLGTIGAMGGLRAEGLDRFPLMEGPFVNLVTPNFFRVAGQRIRDGRGFTESDRAGTERVVAVNTTFARNVWPDRNAVGRCLFIGREATDCTTVIGVVESPLEMGLEDTGRVPHFYLPIAQAAAQPAAGERLNRGRSLIVRTRGNPGRTVPPVLAALAELFPDLPADRVRSLPTVFAQMMRSWTIGTGLLGSAALLALLLAALGLYAVIAFGVRQRELEFGIRRALGAQARDLLRLVLVRGLSLAVVGVVAGGLAALWAGRFVAPLLFEGRSPRDPLAFAAAALVLVTAALAASFFPARRASQADPRRALQAE